MSNLDWPDLKPAPEGGKRRLIVGNRREDHFYALSPAGKAFGSLVGDRRVRPRRLSAKA